jgi:hypothetical protein
VEEIFAIASSERPDEEAIKEVSLKIKSVFPKTVKAFFVFFTPHYQPSALLKNIALTLNPQVTLGIQAPALIFEDRVIEHGIVGCCLNKADMEFREIFSRGAEPEEIEATMRRNIRNLTKEKQFLFSFFPATASPTKCLRGLELSLGKIFNGMAGGFIKTYATKNYQLLNDTVDEGLASVLATGIEPTSLRLEGFLPLGKPFTITRMRANRNLILEINNRPAINIYKHYLDEKFDLFMRNRLFTLYPIGIKDGQGVRLVNILDYLDDGSLGYIGHAREDAPANLMIFHPPSFIQSLKRTLNHEITRQGGVAFVISPTVRKKILKDYATEEIRLIKNQLGERIKMVGLYADYAAFPDPITKEGIVETGNTYITLFQ